MTTTEEALRKVLVGALSHAEARRLADPDYSRLFKRYEDGGIGTAVAEAEQRMRSISLVLLDVLSKHGQAIDRELMLTTYGLPLVMYLLRQDIEEIEGGCCCSDKARLRLREFVQSRLGVQCPAEEPRDD